MKFSPLKLIPFVSIPALLISFQNCSKVGTNGISVDQIQSGQSADLLPQVSDVAMDPGATTPPKNQDPANTNTTNTSTTNTSTSNTSTSNTNTTTNNTNTSTQNDDKKCTNCQASNQHHHHDGEDDDKDCHDRDKNPSSDKKHSEDNDKEDDDHDDDHKQSNTDLVITDAIKACNDPKLLSQPSDNLVLQFNHESIELDANSVSSIKGNWGRYVIIRAAAKENAKVGSVHVNHTTLILCNFTEIREINGTHNRIIVVDGKIQDIHANNSNISLVNASVERSKGANSVIKSYTKE